VRSFHSFKCLTGIWSHFQCLQNTNKNFALRGTGKYSSYDAPKIEFPSTSVARQNISPITHGKRRLRFDRSTSSTKLVMEFWCIIYVDWIVWRRRCRVRRVEGVGCDEMFCVVWKEERIAHLGRARSTQTQQTFTTQNRPKYAKTGEKGGEKNKIFTIWYSLCQNP